MLSPLNPVQFSCAVFRCHHRRAIINGPQKVPQSTERDLYQKARGVPLPVRQPREKCNHKCNQDFRSL
jgi:hypothetical protein